MSGRGVGGRCGRVGEGQGVRGDGVVRSVGWVERDSRRLIDSEWWCEGSDDRLSKELWVDGRGSVETVDVDIELGGWACCCHTIGVADGALLNRGAGCVGGRLLTPRISSLHWRGCWRIVGSLCVARVTAVDRTRFRLNEVVSL